MTYRNSHKQSCFQRICTYPENILLSHWHELLKHSFNCLWHAVHLPRTADDCARVALHCSLKTKVSGGKILNNTIGKQHRLARRMESLLLSVRKLRIIGGRLCNS